MYVYAKFISLVQYLADPMETCIKIKEVGNSYGVPTIILYEYMCGYTPKSEFESLLFLTNFLDLNDFVHPILYKIVKETQPEKKNGLPSSMRKR